MRSARVLDLLFCLRLTVATQSAQSSASAQPVADWVQVKESKGMDQAEAIALIEERHAQITEQNLYEVLGVSEDAKLKEIKASYRALARQFHTDRFQGMNLGEHGLLLDEIFKKIALANTTLSNAKKREEYDLKLAGKDDQTVEEAEMARIFEAEEAYRRAKFFLDRGEFDAALERLRIAIKVNEEDNETQAYFAYAEFMVAKGKGKEGRRVGEKALEKLKAIALADKENEECMLLYARSLHLSGNDDDRAEKLFRYVLNINRNNREAERGIRLIQQRRQQAAEDSTFLGKLKKFFNKKV